MLKPILHELKHHAPFTIFGALIGIIIFIFIHSISKTLSYGLFYIFHPLHVILSAYITTSMYLIKKGKTNVSIITVFLIGYIGSIGVASISDSFMPYIGEYFLGLTNREAHIGIIEEPFIISFFAILGVILAYLKSSTKISHSIHVFVSTFASLFHIIMALNGTMNPSTYFFIFIILFLAVWIPCCLSDIVFPIIFVEDGRER